MRAEGDRGLAIQNTGEAVASRAIRGQCISFFRCPGSVVQEEERRRPARGVSHVYCSEEIGDAARKNLPPSPVDLYYSTRREELRCRRPRERKRGEDDEDTQNVLTEKNKTHKKEKKRGADDSCIFWNSTGDATTLKRETTRRPPSPLPGKPSTRAYPVTYSVVNEETGGCEIGHAVSCACVVIESLQSWI